MRKEVESEKMERRKRYERQEYIYVRGRDGVLRSLGGGGEVAYDPAIDGEKISYKPT